VALAAAACTESDTGGQASGDGEPTIGFASPEGGASVAVPFDVELDSSVPLGEPETGNHHAHIYFDTAPGAADYDIVYGTTWQVTRQLAPGEHTLTVALANPDHSLAGPTQEITVVVGETGGSAPPVSEPTTGPIY
jgi:hypothetical protein